MLHMHHTLCARNCGHCLEVYVKENMRHVLCICNDKHAGKCLFRDGGGRYPSQTAVKSQPPGNTRTSPRTNLQCKRECRQSLYGSDPKVGVGGPG